MVSSYEVFAAGLRNQINISVVIYNHFGVFFKPSNFDFKPQTTDGHPEGAQVGLNCVYICGFYSIFPKSQPTP